MTLKAAASLTGSLLARKGAAYPASYSSPTPSSDGDSDSAKQRAYNDPRVIASAPPAPVAPGSLSGGPTPQQGEQLQDGRFASYPSAGDDAAASSDQPGFNADAAFSSVDDIAADSNTAEGGVGLPQTMDKMGRVRLSVRLDPDRYLRVKMASARTRWSAQDIVIAALDRYLGARPGSKPDDGDAGDGGSQGNLN